ncbi:hypothetical protein M444_02085 [Streptomyces sp. Mg1]|nr:hypothetical protein M444_02085 [Streptomyces sp. Mg1]
MDCCVTPSIELYRGSSARHFPAKVWMTGWPVAPVPVPRVNRWDERPSQRLRTSAAPSAADALRMSRHVPDWATMIVWLPGTGAAWAGAATTVHVRESYHAW